MSDTLLTPEIVRNTPSEAGGRDAIARAKLANALAQGIYDPKDLAKAAGLANATQALITLDRMRNRKEMAAAFAMKGINIDKITDRINFLLDSDKPKAVVDGIKLVMTITGMDSGDFGDGNGGSWQEAVTALRLKAADSGSALQEAAVDYSYVEPELPDSEVRRHAREAAEAESIREMKGERP